MTVYLTKRDLDVIRLALDIAEDTEDSACDALTSHGKVMADYQDNYDAHKRTIAAIRRVRERLTKGAKT